METAQQCGQVIARHYRRGGEGERAALKMVQVGKDLADFIEQAEQAAGVGVEDFALAGKGDFFVRAVKEDDVQRVFQPLDVLADSRLGEETQARRPGETAALGGTVKGFQMLQIDAAGGDVHRQAPGGGCRHYRHRSEWRRGGRIRAFRLHKGWTNH